MQDPGIKQRISASRHRGIGRIFISNGSRILAAVALLLTASSAMAGIIFVPVGGQFAQPELAPVGVENRGGGKVALSSDGLTGEWTIAEGDLPPGLGLPAAFGLDVTFGIDLDELVIDVAGGTLSANKNDIGDPAVTATFTTSSHSYTGTLVNVSGDASCVPLNGHQCGQLVVQMELRTVLTDPTNPSVVGKLRLEMLGSLTWDGAAAAQWASMSATGMIGVNRVFFDLWVEGVSPQ